VLVNLHGLQHSHCCSLRLLYQVHRKPSIQILAVAVIMHTTTSRPIRKLTGAQQTFCLLCYVAIMLCVS
jgi:hypothetical protein